MNKATLEKFENIDARMCEYIGIPQQRFSLLKKDFPKFGKSLSKGWEIKCSQDEAIINKCHIETPNLEKLSLCFSNGWTVEMYEIMCLSCSKVENFIATNGIRRNYDNTIGLREIIKWH